MAGKNIRTIAQEYVSSQRVSEADYERREEFLTALKDYARDPINEFKFSPKEWVEFDDVIEEVTTNGA